MADNEWYGPSLIGIERLLIGALQAKIEKSEPSRCTLQFNASSGR